MTDELRVRMVTCVVSGKLTQVVGSMMVLGLISCNLAELHFISPLYIPVIFLIY